MDSRKYEIVVIYKAGLTDDESKVEIEKTKKLMEKHGGKISLESSWGRRRLAYPVNKQTHGIYHFFWIEAGTDMVEKVELQFGYEENILKYLVILENEFEKSQQDFEALKNDPAKNANLVTETIGV